MDSMLVACALVVFVGVAVGSPNADSITPDVAGRYSNDIYEDARLDVPELVRKSGYPLEVHEVTTSDGYILQMHRIPHGRDRNNQPGPRTVVFVQHGLLCSSADWVLMGPSQGLAYILAEEGYDVWMGNARGNYYSKTHTHLRPEAILNTLYWDFSTTPTTTFSTVTDLTTIKQQVRHEEPTCCMTRWKDRAKICDHLSTCSPVVSIGIKLSLPEARDGTYSFTSVPNGDAAIWHEIGVIDLPTMIDYALLHTGQRQLHYVGHSQGTTSFFVMASTRPQYNEKIMSMHALAPVAFMAHNDNMLLRFIAPFSHSLEVLSSWIGIGEFLPNNNIMTWAGQSMCEDEAFFQDICTSIMFLIGGRNEDQLNATMLPVILGHTPAGASTKQFAHYGQGIADRHFRFYNNGRLGNYRAYGSFTPPSYNLGRITTPVFLHYSDSDPMAHVSDVFNLFSQLPNAAGMFRVSDPNFSHLDFMWAKDVKVLLYNRILNLIRAMTVAENV